MSSRVSVSNKRRFLDDSGYSLFVYSGKLKDAPQQVKHILHGSSAGWYTIHLGIKSVYPLPIPPPDLVGVSQVEWLATEAFYTVLAHHLFRMDWAFFNLKGEELTVLDMRPDPRWDASEFEGLVRTYPERYPNGYYAVTEKTEVGPHTSERGMLEDAAIRTGMLDGYYTTDLQPVGKPFDGVLRPVNVAANVYGLMTDHNQMLATVLNNPSLGDALATARMLALAPEMLTLIDRLAISPADEYAQIAEWADALRKRVFEAA